MYLFDFNLRKRQDSDPIRPIPDYLSALIPLNHDNSNFEYEPTGYFTGSNSHKRPTMGELIYCILDFENLIFSRYRSFY